MADHDPAVVRWTSHAWERAERLGIPFSDVEDGLLGGHSRRRTNPREADWLLDVGRYTIAYNHPHDGDELAALVVTLWRGA